MTRSFQTWIFLWASLMIGGAYGCIDWGSSGPKASVGSGSGFDSAFSIEQEAIDHVTREGGCLDVDGTVICAPNPALPEETTGEMPSDAVADQDPEPEALVIDPASGTGIPCVVIAGEEACTFDLAIRHSGFPADTAFFAAVRFQDSSLTWESGLSPFLPSDQDPARLDLTVRVSGLTVNETVLMQLAVLIYLPGTEFPPVSAGDLLLRNFGADRIYVVEDVSVEGSLAD